MAQIIFIIAMLCAPALNDWTTRCANEAEGANGTDGEDGGERTSQGE